MPLSRSGVSSAQIESFRLFLRAGRPRIDHSGKPSDNGKTFPAGRGTF